jgi:hypothetical protein
MSFRRSLTFAWAAAVLLASSSVVEGGALVRLLAPRDGAVLAAGAGAEIAWEPLAPLAGIEEWEAFLSFDDGESYPVRLTPHLDRDLQRVRWRVPAVPTKRARLLLRFGDERREETFVPLPQRFSIVPSPGMERDLLLARVSPSPGEPALPGGRGTVSWMEGDRRGGNLRQAVMEPLSFRPGVRAPVGHREAALLASEEEGPSDPHASAPSRMGASPAAGPRSACRGHLPDAARATDILLLIQRQNE